MITRKQFVDCLVKEIGEEAEDQAKYMKMAYDVPGTYQALFLRLAKEEGAHRDSLIQMLANVSLEEDTSLWTTQTRTE